MENASKALIIAGAILISILLISLGIVMFNASKSTTGKASDTTNVMDRAANKELNSMENSLGL